MQAEVILAAACRELDSACAILDIWAVLSPIALLLWPLPATISGLVVLAPTVKRSFLLIWFN
jgi:hypothetical protein